MGLRATALLLSVAAGAAEADYDPSAYPPYETCALCHGLYGVSHTAKFPNLGGQKPDYIEAQIRAFLSGTRTNDGGQMATIVTELEPEAIPVVVAWFSTQDPPNPYAAEDTDAGADLFFALGCAGCHDNAVDGPPDVPFLTAQHPGYLAKQMTDFRDGRRDAVSHPGLHTSLLAIAEAQIQAIATYLAAEPRP